MSEVDLAASLRLQAHANRLANHRLHGAMAPLAPSEWLAPRTGFFPSLGATLNHVLAVDTYYTGSLLGEPDLAAGWVRFVPADSLAALRERQAASDERLMGFCATLDAPACQRVVVLERAGGRLQRERVAHVLAHLFMHQTHHRGQAHAMLSGTAVAPPQLDDFLMPSEPHVRVADMAALGWDEAAIYGARV